MKKTKLFVINSIIIIISSLFIEIICAVFDIFLANKLGAEIIGIYGLVFSIYMFTVTIATSGINLAVTKITSEELEKKNSSIIPKIIKNCFIYSLIMGLVACFLLIVFTPVICDKWLINKVEPRVLYMLAISLPFISTSSAITGYFMAIRNALKVSVSQVLSEITRIVIVFILVMFLFPNDTNSSLLALIIGNTISDVVPCLFLYASYLKRNKNSSLCHSKKDFENSRIFKICIPIAITSYIRSGLNTLKQILIPIRLKLSGMSYEKAIARYGIISCMALPIIMFPSVIVFSYSSLLIPEFSRFSVHPDKSVMHNAIRKMFSLTLYFSIAIAGILMYFGKEIGFLLYNNYEVGWYIKLLAPLIPLIYLDNVIDSILKGLGKQVSVMCCNILDLAISVSFIYFLLPVFGSLGYIIVMYISEILNYSISVVSLFKEINLKFNYKDWVIIPIVCILLAIVVTNFFNFSCLNNLLYIIFKIALCVLCYISLLFCFKLCKKH